MSSNRTFRDCVTVELSVKYCDSDSTCAWPFSFKHIFSHSTDHSFFYLCNFFFFTSSKSSSQSSPNVQPSQVTNKRLQLQQDDINGPCGPSKPPSSPSPSHAANPHPQSQSCDCQPSVRPAGRLFPRWELHFITEKNCLIVKTQPPPSSFFILQERVGSSAGHGGIMQWPGFRGHFTHCLRGISRNASLHSHPLRSAEGPLTATLSGNALNIFVHRYSTQSYRPHGF